MVQADRGISLQRTAAAARRLVEGDMTGAPEGRFSHTVFVGMEAGDRDVERYAIDAALAEGLGLVSMRFDRAAIGMPRRVTVAMMHDGRRLVVNDCVLWAENEGRAVLVPWNSCQDCHFAVGDGVLERRLGRPAVPLGRGMSIARLRLERTARRLRSEELGPLVLVTNEPLAA